MHTVFLMFLLVPGAAPQATTDQTYPAPVADGPADNHDQACAYRGGLGTDVRHTLSQPLRSRLSYACHTDCEPGTLRDPVDSWFKHTYLAYRGNYYCAGYDYQRQFDYPWHHARSRTVGFVPYCVGPPKSEEIPVPLPERIGTRPGVPRATAAARKPTDSH